MQREGNLKICNDDDMRSVLFKSTPANIFETLNDIDKCFTQGLGVSRWTYFEISNFIRWSCKGGKQLNSVFFKFRRHSRAIFAMLLIRCWLTLRLSTGFRMLNFFFDSHNLSVLFRDRKS